MVVGLARCTFSAGEEGMAPTAARVRGPDAARPVMLGSRSRTALEVGSREAPGFVIVAAAGMLRRSHLGGGVAEGAAVQRMTGIADFRSDIEVYELHGAEVALVSQHHVMQLHVAVDDLSPAGERRTGARWPRGGEAGGGAGFDKGLHPAGPGSRGLWMWRRENAGWGRDDR